MATDIFLKLDGIKGESADDRHKDEIDILSFSWGMTNTGSVAGGGGGGAGAGRVSVQDFSLTSMINTASPQLLLACATGEHIKEGLITVRKAGGDKPLEYLKYKFSDIMVTKVEQAGSGGSDMPAESFSLNFQKIEVMYIAQKADGSQGPPVTFGWDLKKGKPV